MPSTANLRRLNESGVARFTDFLDSLTGDAPMPYPSALLSDPEATEEIQPPIAAEQRAFGRRYAAAEYFYNLFKDSGLTSIERDQCLWAWLSRYYFDEIIPRVSEEVAESPTLRASPAAVEAATHLNYNPETTTIRRNRSGKGGPRRLVGVLAQFDATWEISSMSIDDLWDLLPEEFGHFKRLYHPSLFQGIAA